MERGREPKRGRGKIASGRIRWKFHFHAKPKYRKWTSTMIGLHTRYEYVSQSSSRVRFPTDSNRGDFSSPSLRSSPSLHRSSLFINRLSNQGTISVVIAEIVLDSGR